MPNKHQKIHQESIKNPSKIHQKVKIHPKSMQNPSKIDPRASPERLSKMIKKRYRPSSKSKPKKGLRTTTPGSLFSSKNDKKVIKKLLKKQQRKKHVFRCQKEPKTDQKTSENH